MNIIIPSEKNEKLIKYNTLLLETYFLLLTKREEKIEKIKNQVSLQLDQIKYTNSCDNITPINEDDYESDECYFLKKKIEMLKTAIDKVSNEIPRNMMIKVIKI